jgi:hypothetical protein
MNRTMPMKARFESISMKNFKQSLATGPDVQMSPMCVVCKRPIVENQWFCRLPQSEDNAKDSQAPTILLCSPACAFRFFASFETETIMSHPTEGEI